MVSCSKQGQLQDQSELLGFLSRLALKTPKDRQMEWKSLFQQHLPCVCGAASHQSLPGLPGHVGGRGWKLLLAIIMVFSLS